MEQLLTIKLSLRVSSADEHEGLDKSSHGEAGYKF